MEYARRGGATKSTGDDRKWEKGIGRKLLATSPPLAKQNPAGTCPITTPLKHEEEASTGYCRHYRVIVVSANVRRCKFHCCSRSFLFRHQKKSAIEYFF